MIPILYNSTEADFTTQGLGALVDAIYCRVTEERNGIYELEMEYPQTGIHFNDIQNGNIITAIPSPYRAAQPFRIYKVTKPLNGNVTVYASHISYDLNKIPVSPFSASSASSALAGIKTNMQIQNNFQFWTDKTTDADFSAQVPAACRSLLGGQEGSILDVYGGEYEWDRFTVRLYNKRGADSGVVIRYGKNLTGLNQEGDISGLVTGICPYWFSDGTLVMCDPSIVYREGMTAQSAVPVDFTQQFETAPTAAQLQEAAESYIENNDIGEPTVSLDVEFIQLEQMSEFEGMALLEKCDLCDTVTVQYEQAGIDVEAEIVSIQTDVLLERYEKMQVGSIRANIAQTIADQQAQISQIGSSSMIQAAIQNSTNWITGGRGGYVIFQLNANGQPDEILIMDQPSVESAQKVWRWNQGGLGYSENGYDGPYTTAITQDGAIVADFITAGSLLANIIHGGTLTLGGQNNGNGVCQVMDANGNVVAELNSDGVNIKKGGISVEAGDLGYKALNISYNPEIPGTINQNVRVFADPTGFTARTHGEFANGTEGIFETAITGSALYMASFSGGTVDGPDYNTRYPALSISMIEMKKIQIAITGNVSIGGNLTVFNGTKNRAAKTENYGTRLLNAYETAVPYFGDIGTGEISSNGIGIVEIDPIFSETVSLDNYVVFLQAEGPGECYIGEKSRERFAVFGTPGLRFAYEIKAKQKGFENVRLDKYKEEKA